MALHVEPRHRPGRLKQWLNLLRRRFPEAEVAYGELRTLTQTSEVEAWLARAEPQRRPQFAPAATADDRAELIAGP